MSDSSKIKYNLDILYDYRLMQIAPLLHPELQVQVGVHGPRGTPHGLQGQHHAPPVGQEEVVGPSDGPWMDEGI